MSKGLSKFLTYSTLASYLVVGTVAVRFFAPDGLDVKFSTEYLSAVAQAELPHASQVVDVYAPRMHFAQIRIPHAEDAVYRGYAVKRNVYKTYKHETSSILELPFGEIVKLAAVKFMGSLPKNLVALYQQAPVEKETLVAKVEPVVAPAAIPAEEVEDVVSTKMAQSVDAEPTFFEYPTEEKVDSKVEVAKIEEKEDKTVEVAKVEEVKEIKKVEEIKTEEKVVEAPLVEEAITTEVVAASTETENNAEEIAVSDLVAFDYSKAQQDISSNKIATVSKVTTQAPIQQSFTATNTQTLTIIPVQNVAQNQVVVPSQKVNTHPSQLSIKVVGVDLKNTTKAVDNFEIRTQDDLNLAMNDYGQGQIVMKEEMANSKMTRSITVLKNGFIPTNTDVIMEKGVSEVSLPAITEEKFDKLMAPYKGSVGALLVELDDTTELAKIDVPYGKVVQLDGDMKVTSQGDFRYQMFLGVKAGNTLLSYKDQNGQLVSKIVHIHENEVTFDSNFYEEVKNQKVKLLEEDLLAKDLSPLIISGKDVKVFATNQTARKVDDHTYQLNFGKGHLAGRRYIELNHQAEPIFVGVRDNLNVSIPSENFMRFVLSKFEGSNLGNRCLIQVNLTKKAEKMEVGAESTAASLMTYTQVLDSDGKFYDSIGDKTRKIIIVGENQGSNDISKDAKVNVKIEYQDGTTQYLNSYCSPNTYLVEQL